MGTMKKRRNFGDKTGKKLMKKIALLILLVKSFSCPAVPSLERQLLDASTTIKEPLVNQLLKQGANVTVRDPQSNATPLHFAAERSNPEIITALLEKGAQVDVQDFNGFTPLHSAAYFGRFENVKALCQFLLLVTPQKLLSIVNMKDRKGRTAADIAQEHMRQKSLPSPLDNEKDNFPKIFEYLKNIKIK